MGWCCRGEMSSVAFGGFARVSSRLGQWAVEKWVVTWDEDGLGRSFGGRRLHRIGHVNGDG